MTRYYEATRPETIAGNAKTTLGLGNREISWAAGSARESIFATSFPLSVALVRLAVRKNAKNN